MEKETNKSTSSLGTFNLSDIIVYYSIEVSRNIEGYVFPKNMNSDDASILTEKIIESYNSNINTKSKVLFLKNMKDTEILANFERNIITRDLMLDVNKAAYIEHDKNIRILINEEDHIKFYINCKSNELDDVLSEVDYIDDIFSITLGYCFDKKLGYLTSNINNIGTALKCSAYLHLPMIENSDMIEELAEKTRLKNIDFKPNLPSEGQINGSIYKISNIHSLGISEEEIISSVKETALNIARIEDIEFNNFIKRGSVDVLDRIYRSYSILKNSMVISQQEALERLSCVRVGVMRSIIKNISLLQIDELYKTIGQGNLQLMYGIDKELEYKNREIYRSKYLREALKG